MSGVKKNYRVVKVATSDRLLEALSFYQQNPVKYVEDIVLGGAGSAPRPERLEPQQADMLDLAIRHPRIAIRAANGVGKDAVTAWLIEWFLICFFKSKVPVVSPTGRQVRRTIFSEVATWTRHSLAMSKLELLLTNELRHREAPEEWWALGFAPRVQTDDPTGGIEGIHAENLLFIITEAKAVDRAVWDAAKRVCTRENNRILVQSVPGIEAGDFYECFTIKARAWKTFHFPSARWDDQARRWAPTTRLVTEASIKERLAEGEDAPNFRAGVLAEFLRQDSQHLIPLMHVEAAIRDEKAAIRDDDPVELGVDCARFGDDSSVIAPRCGPRVLPLEVHSQLSEMELCGRVVEAIRVHRPSVVRIDVIGIGAGTHDRLVEMQAERVVNSETRQEEPKHPHLQDVMIEGVNVGVRSTDESRWVNLRDELWDTLAARFKAGEVLLPDDAELREELTTVRYKYTSAGQKKIEPKEEHKRRIGRSPDRADAVCLAFGGAEVALPLATL